MKFIKIISDLHLERKFKYIKFKKHELGGNLFLAGDLGSPLKENYWNFLYYASINFDNIYFVSGNHEYWNNKKYTINDIDNLINDKIINLPNVNFLNNKKVFLNNYKILGTTLWSYTKNTKSIDYFKIQYNIQNKMNNKFFCKLFLKNIKWLNNNLNDNIPTIVLTHYLPSYDFTLPNKYYNPFRSLFASNLDYMIKKPIKVWIFGHTHDNFIKKKNNVICAVNAVGRKKNINIKKIYL